MIWTIIQWVAVAIGVGLIFLAGFGYVVMERAKVKDVAELQRTAGIVVAGIVLVVVAVLL